MDKITPKAVTYEANTTNGKQVSSEHSNLFYLIAKGISKHIKDVSRINMLKSRNGVEVALQILNC